MLLRYILFGLSLTLFAPTAFANAYLSAKDLNQLMGQNTPLKSIIESIPAESRQALFYSFPRDNSNTVITCEQKPLNPALLAAVTKKAELVQAYLNQTNPQVALLARVGSDVSEYNMHYTHFAFVLKRPRTNTSKGEEWSVLHLLNTCNGPTSRIYEQGLGNFFLDNLLNLDAKVIVPTPDLQKKLAAVLASNKVTSFHNPNYSMIAYPFSTEYQQSNQWVLELLASALFGATDRTSAQAYLKTTAFIPTLIPINVFAKLGANIFRKNVRFNDHPEHESTEGKYSVVTVDAITHYLKQQQLVSTEKEL